MALLPRWHVIEFTRSIDNRWSWRRLLTDGSIDTLSEPFEDYGNCVYDAIKNGFRPALHHWVVTTPLGVTHYNGKAEIVVIPKGEGTSDPQLPSPIEKRWKRPATDSRGGWRLPTR